MKKYIFTSLLSLFIITGAALGLTPQASAQPVDWEKHFLDGAENDPSVWGLASAAQGKDILIAVGSQGLIAKSTDGKNWEYITLQGEDDSSYYFNSIAYGEDEEGNGTFVIVGSEEGYPAILTSHDDGLTWAILSNRYDDLGEEVSWQNQGDFSKVSYYYDEINKGVFVAVGGGKHSFNYDRAAIYYSYDYGDTWTKATVEPNPGKGFGLALGQNSSGNPIFISTGLDGDTPTSSAKFIISTDLGKNWTWVDGGERSPFGEIGYVNGHFIMAGVAPTMDLGGGGGIIIDFGLGDGPIGDGDSLGDEEDGYPFEVYTSADGVNWWKKFRVTLPEIINASSIAYGDGAYLIAGEDIDYNQMIFYSADGEEWEHYSPNLDSDGLVEILGSVYFKGNFFLFGYNSLSYFDEEDSNPIIFSPKFSLGNGVNRKSPSSTFGVRFCSAGVTSFCRPQGAVPQNNLLANVYTELLGLYQQLLTALQEQNS